jgi:hypothetical protein
MKKILLSLALVMMPLWGQAMMPNEDGVALMSSFNERDAYGATGVGKGYVLGVFDILLAHDEICIASHVSNEQIVDVVKRFSMTHPEALHYRANALVESALRESYPCNNKRVLTK